MKEIEISWSDNFKFIPEADNLPERNFSMFQLDIQNHEFIEYLNQIWDEYSHMYNSPTEALDNHVKIVLQKYE